MRMYDIIEKKKRKTELNEDEIQFFVNGVISGEIPDYQISAFLMAVCFNSMTDAESAALTLAMANSGETADLSEIDGVTADKHSTGGVGDKATLIAAPIAAALGMKVAKLSGRGLGHTGGTIDKLESIPGLKTTLSRSEFISQVNNIGLAVAGQSGDMAPADKKLYALRDVTATVNSVPLIASSIMSKKIASGSDNIVLDVKYGSGAFMKTAAEAEELADKMIAIGKNVGRNTAAVISSMDRPLGYAVGNAAEVIEAVETLKGEGAEDLTELCLCLAALMYSLSFDKPYEEGYALGKQAIEDKSAFNKLCQMVEAQGGDAEFIKNTELFPKAEYSEEITADKDGYISFTDTEKIGIAASMLGAGRVTKDDKIDYSAGILFKKKTGDYVQKGEAIAVLMSQNPIDKTELVKDAIKIADTAPKVPELIYKIIR